MSKPSFNEDCPEVRLDAEVTNEYLEFTFRISRPFTAMFNIHHYGAVDPNVEGAIHYVWNSKRSHHEDELGLQKAWEQLARGIAYAACNSRVRGILRKE